MKISLTFLEGTAVCTRQGLKKIELDFEGTTLGELLAALPGLLGPEADRNLRDPALQLILTGHILTAPFDPDLRLAAGAQLYFLVAPDGG